MSSGSHDVATEVLLLRIRSDPSKLIEDPRGWLLRAAADSARPDAILDVERALRTLSPRQRTVLRMQFAEGLRYAEIAARLGSTPNQIKGELLTSYRKLREQGL